LPVLSPRSAAPALARGELVEPLEHGGHVAQEAPVVEELVQLLGSEPLGDLALLLEQLAERPALVPRGLCGALDDPVGASRRRPASTSAVSALWLKIAPCVSSRFSRIRSG